MKIINREEFLKLPSNTLFHKYQSLGIFGELQIKICDPEDGWVNDFNTVSIASWVEEMDNSKEWYDLMIECEKKGNEFKFDLECGCRDGLYEDEQLFAVYDKPDIDKLINKLKSLL